MFTIVSNGKTYRYATLEAALKVADKIFIETGVVVGIEREPHFIKS